jgi:TPR repeat protein
VAQDLVTAYVWFSLAAAQGDKDAATNRDLTADLLTPDQIEYAQSLVRSRQPTAPPAADEQ